DSYDSNSLLTDDMLHYFDSSNFYLHNSEPDIINQEFSICDTDPTILPVNYVNEYIPHIANVTTSHEHSYSIEHTDSNYYTNIDNLTPSHEHTDSNDLYITPKLQSMSSNYELSYETCLEPNIDMVGDGGSLDSHQLKLSHLPGFRFHPTEQELVGFYLRGKVEGALPPSFTFIPEVELYLHDPWDLVADKGSQKEWFFFVPRDKKHLKGARPNRQTKYGFWKATGIDKIVKLNDPFAPSHYNGLRKTLVYYKGRAPNGSRTPWIMNEYRLANNKATNQHSKESVITLCKLYQKKMLYHPGSEVPLPQNVCL
ncbi:hypothetical protein GOP47_0023770, partial [Adiantum capillus-veneris]